MTTKQPTRNAVDQARRHGRPPVDAAEERRRRPRPPRANASRVRRTAASRSGRRASWSKTNDDRRAPTAAPTSGGTRTRRLSSRRRASVPTHAGAERRRQTSTSGESPGFVEPVGGLDDEQEERRRRPRRRRRRASRRRREPPTTVAQNSPVRTASTTRPMARSTGCSSQSLNSMAPNCLSSTASQKTGSEKNRKAANVRCSRSRCTGGSPTGCRRRRRGAREMTVASSTRRSVDLHGLRSGSARPPGPACSDAEVEPCTHALEPAPVALRGTGSSRLSVAVSWAICWSLLGLCDSRRIASGSPEIVTRTKTRNDDASRIGIETSSRRTMNSEHRRAPRRLVPEMVAQTDVVRGRSRAPAPGPTGRRGAGQRRCSVRRRSSPGCSRSGPDCVGLNSTPVVSSAWASSPGNVNTGIVARSCPQDRVDLVGQLGLRRPGRASG